MRTLASLVVLVAASAGAQTNWCVQNPQPDNKCDAHGDPATVAGGFTWHSSTDISIDTPAGPFSLDRTFYSDNESGLGAWAQVLGTNNVPRPFSGPGTRVQWWHSLFSFVYSDSQFVWYVTGQNGNRHRFQAVDSLAHAACLPPGSCSWQRNYTWGRQLRSISTGFIVSEPDRSTRYYEAKFISDNPYYFLTKLVNPQGATLADLSYSAPSGTINCPSASPPLGQVSPYISIVTLAGGHLLKFRYAQPAGAGTSCLLKAIDYQPALGGSVFELVDYTVLTSPAGRVTSATFRQGDAGTESYDYSGAGFAVQRSGATVFRHQYDGGPVDRATQLNGNGNWPTVNVVSQAQGVSSELPLTTTGFACRDQNSASYGVVLTTTTAGTAGDSMNSSATLTMGYQTSRNDTIVHRRYRLRDTAACGGSEACSPGESRYELRPTPSVEGGSTGVCVGEVSVSAVKDKRNNWTLTPKVSIPVIMADGGSISNNLALAGVQRGAYEDGGKVVAPLEAEAYTYLSRPAGRYAMQTKTMAGGLTSNVVTTYAYDDTDAGLRLTREVTAGSTLSSVATGAVAAQFRATFYRPKPSDPLQRVEIVEGPCWVNAASDTTCASSNPDGGTPFAKYEYYGSTSDSNSQRLSKTTRNAGTSGVQLVAEYSAYTPEGDPGKVRTYALGGGAGSEQIDTDFLYSGRRPISQKVYRSSAPGTFAETRWYYDEDQLTAVRYPEGNFEVMCYRTSAFPACTGTLTKKLRWRAKSDAYPLAAWSERIEYDYDANGYQLEERRFVFGDSNPRLRNRTHPDLHGRATYSRSGGTTSATNFEPKAHFDGADNRDAFGPPANVPPDYCRGGAGVDSPLCWWFRYDRADRLNRANAPGSPNPLSRSCFDYDAAGNITQVSTGDTSLNCDTSLNAPGTQTGSTSSSTALKYKWDDFGNIIEVTNTGADTNGSAPTRYKYDAQGNVIEKRTPAMAAGDSQTFQYDGLGRLLRVTRVGTTPIVLYTLEYDAAAGPVGFMTTREFLAGRLARRNDSYGSTWYGYDYLGNTLSEYRDRTSCDLSKGVYCRPHTSYAWDRNGNLKAITYPFGRVVSYVYAGGAAFDRIASVKSTVWLSGGAKTRALLGDIGWEPYGGLRGYTTYLNDGTYKRAVEYYLGTELESDPTAQGDCTKEWQTLSTDGSGRTRGLFVSESGSFAPSSMGHAPGPYVFAQRYGWGEDQVTQQNTCLGATEYRQSFGYDQMQRLTSESMVNFPAFAGESASETKVFDARGNRIDGARDGYDVLDQAFDATAKDRMSELCWWRGFLVGPTQCFVGYNYAYNASGAMTQVTALKPGSASPWNLSFEYPSTAALSDVYTFVKRNGVVLRESYYDAFGRRRAKQNGVGDMQEFTYDLGHQLLVDQTYSINVVGGTADEYIWLDGRPVLTFRSNLSATGAHSNDYVEVPNTGTGDCNRPLDDGVVQCGLFRLVSNLQGFVNLAMHDYDGKVASFQLPDADGTVNQPRMNTFGGLGTAYAQRFNVPASFSKQARFRTSWTGPVPGYWGVNSFQLDGTTVLTPGGGEVGRAWSDWSPVTSGTSDVVWSTSCGTPCASASDMFEWKTWETGAAQFHTRLRFPGQYQDSETDFFENWNRYYEPTTGRYVSPEPFLQQHTLSETAAREGLPLPAFAYARANPVSNVDPDGNVAIALPLLCVGGGCELAGGLALGGLAAAGGAVCGSMGCFDRPPGPALPPGGAEGGCAGPGDGAPTQTPPPTATTMAEHTKNQRPSNWDKHSKKRPGAPEKGDDKRRLPNKRPPGAPKKGPWPPKVGK